MSARAPWPPSSHEALEEAGRAVREAQRADRDEILGARQALRRAEQLHDRAIRQAQHDLAAARSAPLRATYGRRIALYEDRVRMPAGEHELAPGVRASVAEEGAGRHRRLALVVEGPGWREELPCPARDEATLRELAREIDAAAVNAPSAAAARRAAVAAAEARLASATADRRGVEETWPLLHGLAALLEEGESVLDMARACQRATTA